MRRGLAPALPSLSSLFYYAIRYRYACRYGLILSCTQRTGVAVQTTPVPVVNEEMSAR